MSDRMDTSPCQLQTHNIPEVTIDDVVVSCTGVITTRSAVWSLAAAARGVGVPSIYTPKKLNNNQMVAYVRAKQRPCSVFFLQFKITIPQHIIGTK